MSRRPVVLLDVDGVLADFVNPLLARVATVTGKTFTEDDVTSWDIMESLGIDPPTGALIYDRARERGFCAALPVYKGAQDGVRELREVADIHIVTSPFRSIWWTSEREVWLQQYFSFGAHDITHTHHKHRVVGDYLIDDKVATIVAWKAAHPQGTAILWDRPSNQSMMSLDCTRTKSWAVVCDMIKARCAPCVDTHCKMFHPKGSEFGACECRHPAECLNQKGSV